MNYRDWEAAVPPEIRGDIAWRVEAYRLALFATDLAWNDVTKLMGDKRTLGLANQFYRASGAVSADIEEGCTPSSGKDRARFYEYALGPAREARGWYFKACQVLGPQVLEHWLSLLFQIIKLLLRMVPDQREQSLREEPEAYSLHEPPIHILDLLSHSPTP